MSSGVPLPQPSPAAPTPTPRWKRSGITMVAIVIVLFVIEAIDVGMNGRLDQNGILPRQVSGLDGIIWAPFLHADFAHLIGNLIPGAILGFLLLMSGRFLGVTAIVWVVSGFGVWLTGPSGTVTIGASGVVFGWLTYLLVRGIFNRDVWQVLGGVVLFAVYGGLLWGMLPQGGSVSWQGHLFGAAGGVLAAWMLSDRRHQSSPELKGGPR
ncbi:rhomboid family intramembrane serine protease [Gordonia hydrophobica]|uniref:Rhomboid family intramembrane serine protease n=1 Tax=Gordonia hydrophobica TaxID=40516 RepID=A0ABZ2U1E3_9ACTN|nr:rhomboid family intramembrane serine protease [Gordonia hydrophobica]MBM7368591.1 membrane associated rhomboid family serine protease [Gordonia hydrophobica]